MKETNLKRLHIVQCYTYYILKTIQNYSATKQINGYQELQVGTEKTYKRIVWENALGWGNCSVCVLSVVVFPVCIHMSELVELHAKKHAILLYVNLKIFSKSGGILTWTRNNSSKKKRELAPLNYTLCN